MGAPGHEVVHGVVLLVPQLDVVHPQLRQNGVPRGLIAVGLGRRPRVGGRATVPDYRVEKNMVYKLRFKKNVVKKLGHYTKILPTMIYLLCLQLQKSSQTNWRRNVHGCFCARLLQVWKSVSKLCSTKHESARSSCQWMLQGECSAYAPPPG